MRLFLVRHGQVRPPRPGVFYGGTDVPLSLVGESQARAAAALLAGEHIDAVYASPLSRARYGAERLLASRAGLELRIEKGLREIDRGRWVGLTPEEVRRRFPGDLEAHAADPEGWRGHGGESLGDLRDRVLAAHARIAARHGGGTVAIVCHLFPIRALLAAVLREPLHRWEILQLPTGSVSRIDAGEAGPRVAWRGRAGEAEAL